jgi:hypothetical protein
VAEIEITGVRSIAIGFRDRRTGDEPWRTVLKFYFEISIVF